MVFETLEVYFGKHGAYAYGLLDNYVSWDDDTKGYKYIIRVVDYRTRKQHTAYAYELWECTDFISKLKNLDEKLYK